jgi:hypothetical protein
VGDVLFLRDLTRDLVEFIMSSALKRRLKLIIQRFWQPAGACMTCMPGSWGNVLSAAHWAIAVKTGLLTAALALLLTFTPAASWYGDRYRNALLVGCLTAIGDFYAHANHYFLEHVATGVMSGLFALAASYLLEDRARRIRSVWLRWFG